jgi:hypothetical protein
LLSYLVSWDGWALAVREGWTGRLVEVKVGGTAVGDEAGSISVGVTGIAVLVGCATGPIGVAVFCGNAGGNVLVG